MKGILNLGSGYLTIIAGLAGIIWGLYNNDTQAIIIGAGLLGLRRAVSNLK